jgi:Protein of unknown function (DUF1091)
MRGNVIPMQLIQVFLDQLSKFGRLVVPCPILPGHYYLKDAYIDETKMPMYRLCHEDYLVIYEVILKQVMSGKNVQVYNLHAHFMCNQSNWP